MSKKYIIIFFFFVYVVFITAWSLDPSHPKISGIFHDDGVYMCLGRSIVERGIYRDDHTPKPIQIAKYPPGTPLLCALSYKITNSPEGAVTVIRIINIIFLVLGLIAFWILIKQEDLSFPLKILIIGSLAISPPILDYVRLSMSEIPFLSVTMLSILYMQKIETFKDRPKYGIILAILLFTCVLFRSIGITLFIGAAIRLLTLSKKKTFASCTVFFLILFGVLEVFLLHNSKPEQGFSDITVYGLPYSQIFYHALSLYPKVLIYNFVQSILFVSNYLIPLSLEILPLSKTISWIILWIISVSIIVIIIIGFIRHIKIMDTLHYYLIFMVSVIIIWPFQPARFYVPLLPLIYILFFRGTSKLLRNNFLMILGVFILFSNAISSFPSRLSQSIDKFTIEGKDFNLREIFEIGERLERKLPKNSIIASTLDPIFGWHNRLIGVWGWTVEAVPFDLYSSDAKLLNFYISWNREWVYKEIEASREYFLKVFYNLGDPKIKHLNGVDIPPLLKEMEESYEEKVIKEMKKLKVTHAIILSDNGQIFYEVLLSRLLYKLHKQGKAYPIMGSNSGLIQVWRLKL